MSRLFDMVSGVLPTSETPPPVLPEVLDGDNFWEAEEIHMHPDAHPDGGLAFNDKVLVQRQRSAVMEMMGKIGKNLLKGQLDLLKVSLPVKIFEPRSYLEKLADPWVYPEFLDRAAQSSDPVVRLKWVSTYFLAGFHRAFLSWRKPFNPILGETWAAALPDGSHIFLEQVSHHPPVSAFQLFGGRGLYRFEGSSEPSVGYRANTVKTTAKGMRRLRFHDGSVVHVTFPVYLLRGMLSSSVPRATLCGSATFVDERSGVEAHMLFGSVTPGGSAESGLGLGPRGARLSPRQAAVLQRPDSCGVVLYAPADSPLLRASSAADGRPAPRHRALSESRLPRVQPDSQALLGGLSRALGSGPAPRVPEPSAPGLVPVAAGAGNWLSHAAWDGLVTWDIHANLPARWQREPEALASDCRHREDLARLGAGDVAGAQEAKQLLEKVQRADANLRKQGRGEA